MSEITSGRRVKIAAGGRIVIPANVRRRLGVGVGDELLISERDGVATLSTPAGHLRWVRSRLAAAGVDSSRSLVDELLAERRTELDR
jgi:AbrB family looped-hinge helix DNA binding protein